MSSADIREIAACGFQIGMIAGYTCFAQLFCLLYSQNAQRSANFNVQFFFNTFQGTADIFKVIGLALSATAGNDGEAYSACFLSFFSCIEDFLFAQQTVFLNSGMIMCGLCTELAVLAAFTAAAVDDCTAINSIAGIFLANLVSHGQKQHGVIIAHVNQKFSFFFSNILTVQNLLGQCNNLLHCNSHP